MSQADIETSFQGGWAKVLRTGIIREQPSGCNGVRERRRALLRELRGGQMTANLWGSERSAFPLGAKHGFQ